MLVRPELLSGSPTIEGTRIPVRRLWSWHRKGVPIATLVARYGSLGWAKVLSALAFAHDNVELVEADLDRERALLEEVDPTYEKQLRIAYHPGVIQPSPLRKREGT